MDAHNVLGIAKNASSEDIKQAYLKLARQHHPDVGGDASKFKEVQSAYDILSNNKTVPPQHATNPHNINPAEFSDLFTEDRHPFGDIFSQFTNKPQPKPVTYNTTDSEIEFNLKANLEQIKKGATATISYKRNKLCPDCNGQGGQQKTHCGYCRGAGIITVKHKSPDPRSPVMIQQTVCNSCNGKGVLWNIPCRLCSTDGYIQQSEQIKVKINEDK
jgi:molecular chaperone DnaJ